LLIKLLDCCDLLSIQVHPSDELAPRLSKETQGKTEAWVVLDVQSTGRIFSGLKEGVGRADLERHLQAGTLAECLHSFTPQPGDCLFLPAGTVHAVGGGVVMAEVQQSSDATFRLFDWNRLGLDGKPRPVHLRESLESIDWNAGPVSPVPGTPLSGLPQGVQGEHLVQCRYFALARFQGVKPFELPYRGRLSIWLVLQGAVQLRSADPGYQRQFQAGQAALIPAACGALFWQPAGPATLLGVTLGS
jgi:mannose-6-phosphate isomerase